MLSDDPRPRKRRRPPARRKTVRWSAREVDALLAGVRRHGVGKWAAILRHSKVFNGVRTSVDLKDKWRNLTSPVRAAALAARAPAPAPSDDVDLVEHHPTPDSLPSSPTRSSSPLPLAQAPIPASPDNSLSDVLSLSTTHHHHQQDTTQLAAQDHSEAHSQSPCNSQSPSHIHPQMQSHSQSNSQCHSQSMSKYPSEAEVSNDPPLLPPPPSESSVSPEVLSTPSAHQPQPSAHPPGAPSLPFPPQASSHLYHQQAHPVYAPMHSMHPQVAAMQQAIGQSLYQSAAAIAAYWRRLGHEPNAYAIAAALTASSGTPNSSPYFSAPGAPPLYAAVGDDDDDDDDDDDGPVTMPIYPYPFSTMVAKDPVHMPYGPILPQGLVPTPGPVGPMMQAAGPHQAKEDTTQTGRVASGAAVKSEGTTEPNGLGPEAKVPDTIVKTEPESVQGPLQIVTDSDVKDSPLEAPLKEKGQVDTDGGTCSGVEEELPQDASSGLEYLNVEAISVKTEEVADQMDGIPA